MSELVKSVDLKDGNVLEVYHDEHPHSPRDWDCNIGIMAAFHRDYGLTDKDVPFKQEMFESWEEVEYYIQSTLKAMVCLPLYMYNHSGITIATTPFNCRWDSGQIGFVYTTAKKLGQKGFNQTNNESWEEYVARVKESLEAEVKTFDQYVRGETYGYKVIDKEGDDVESCWGFLGDDLKTNGILDNISSEPVNLGDL
jgi:hypothetical protein